MDRNQATLCDIATICDTEKGDPDKALKLIKKAAMKSLAETSPQPWHDFKDALPPVCRSIYVEHPDLGITLEYTGFYPKDFRDDGYTRWKCQA